MIALLALAPPAGLIALRAFVLSQVPLKTTADPSFAFAALLAVVATMSLLAAASGALQVLKMKRRG